MICSFHNISSQRGFTLIEIMIATIVFSSIFITIGWVYNQGQKVMETEEDKRIALTLAQQMMEEIITKEFRDPDVGEETGPAQCWECDHIPDYIRADLDDIDDYDGWSRGIALPLETMDGTPMDGGFDASGNPVPDYSMPPNLIAAGGVSLFRRQVTVTPVVPQFDGQGNFTGFGTYLGGENYFLQVTVMVSSLRDIDFDKNGLQIGFYPVVLTRVISPDYR